MLHVYKGFDLSNNVCEYEVNRLITKKVIIVNDAARTPTFPSARRYLSIHVCFWYLYLTNET